MANEAVYIGIDLGGTNIKAIAVTGNGVRLCEKNVVAEAERGPDAVISKMVP